MFKQTNFMPRKTQKIVASVGAIALGLTATMLFPTKNIAQEEIQEGKTNVTVDKITGNVDEYIGQMVTIRSEVASELDELGFILQGEEFLLLNAGAEPVMLPGEDVPVQATGMVREFILADIESEYGIDLDDELYVDYENKPAIVAESLALAPTIEQLAADPSAFYNQVIAVEGEVRDFLSSNTMTLFEDGWIDDIGLLVVDVNQILDSESSAVQEGETVVVTGMAQELDPNILLQDPELGWDEDEITEFESRYTSRPVIVADDVYPSALDE